MTYGNIYVASVAMGAKNEHTLRAFMEAESYDGPSLIIAYSHCIAHGINMAKGMQQQQAAVESGRWLLYRYDPPRRLEQGENPLLLDSRKPKRPLEQAMYSENRFKMLLRSKPEEAKQLLQGSSNQRGQPLPHVRVPGRPQNRGRKPPAPQPPLPPGSSRPGQRRVKAATATATAASPKATAASPRAGNDQPLPGTTSSPAPTT